MKEQEKKFGKLGELEPEKLRWRCEPARLPFETTAQAELREGFVGQERALRALKMGVELGAPGYNVFVCGLAGTKPRRHDCAHDRRVEARRKGIARPMLRK